MKNILYAAVVALVAVAATTIPADRLEAQTLTPRQQLGKLMYFDRNLSTPAGEACADCHHPSAGFADPRRAYPVSQGVIPTRFGNRNAPTSAYATYTPPFHYDASLGKYVGGTFWDGRADNLTEQAKGPFRNPLEMANPDGAAVVASVQASAYATQFTDLFGPTAFDNPDRAFDNIAAAIADYESTNEVNQFSSKYDAYINGRVSLTATEQRGLAIFTGRGSCSTCHTATAGPYSAQPLFTNYSYENLGIPKNPANPFYTLPAEFNPAGYAWIDSGLGKVIHSTTELGKMKVPTLRNIAVTAPYMHNGIFSTLSEVLAFYNSLSMGGMMGGRGMMSGGGTMGGGGMMNGGGCMMGGNGTMNNGTSMNNGSTMTNGGSTMGGRGGMGSGMFGVPEMPLNITTALNGICLTPQDQADLIAFLNTLTDGYTVSAMGSTPVGGMKVNMLLQNQPNPFNPTTTIGFILPERSRIVLKIYNALGQEIRTLADEEYSDGAHRVTWDAGNLPSGVYFCRLTTPVNSETRKMILMR